MRARRDNLFPFRAADTAGLDRAAVCNGKGVTIVRNIGKSGGKSDESLALRVVDDIAAPQVLGTADDVGVVVRDVCNSVEEWYLLQRMYTSLDP